jgi:hypothetical protein
VLLAAFAANYYNGRLANRRIALSWSALSLSLSLSARVRVRAADGVGLLLFSVRGRTFAQLLDSNFSRVGEGGGLLIKESENRYRVPATGRRNCHGLQATLNVPSLLAGRRPLASFLCPFANALPLQQLARRHDLFATVYEFFMPTPDTLVRRAHRFPSPLLSISVCSSWRL